MLAHPQLYCKVTSKIKAVDPMFLYANLQIKSNRSTNRLSNKFKIK